MQFSNYRVARKFYMELNFAVLWCRDLLIRIENSMEELSAEKKLRESPFRTNCWNTRLMR